MNFASPDFHKFLSFDCDRATFIQEWLLSHGVKTHRLVMSGKNHILIQYSSNNYDLNYKIKTIVAHYDRVLGSKGANDNSAAVWMLMNWAVFLKDCDFNHNVRILFTDGEELGGVGGVREQGAYALAETFMRIKAFNDDIFVFDSCGRGTVPVLADTTLPSGISDIFRRNFEDLYRRTRLLLNQASGGHFTRLPIPYSDNAAFLSCGIPCVAITMLPANEAQEYYTNLLKNPLLEKFVMNKISAGGKEMVFRKFFPKTWQLFHTVMDDVPSLTEESIPVMGEIFTAIANLRTPSLRP